MKIKINTKAPDFKVLKQDNTEFNITKDCQNQNIVFYFYPKDDTPGCTIEAQEFNAMADQFAKENTKIIGISKDSVKSHQKFINKFDLKFDLLADESKEICNLYDVLKEKAMYGKKYLGISRTTFLIDKNKIIRYIWEDVKPQGHAKEVLEKIKQINSDQNK